jgi:hypothetical protein
LWTAWVSVAGYPQASSYALLAEVGARGPLAGMLLYGAASLNLLLGLTTLAMPAHQRRPLWLLQIALILIYTAIITVKLPAFWLHPFGPISKNLVLLAVLVLLWQLEPGWPTRQAAAERPQG